MRGKAKHIAIYLLLCYNIRVKKRKDRSTVDIINYKYGDKIEYKPLAVALGLFDGVHRGHRRLIELTRKKARERGLACAVLTFNEGGGLKSQSPRLYTQEQRLELFSSLGVDLVILCDFPSVRDKSAEDFIGEVLIDGFNCQVALSGYNFRFGKGATGNADLLCDIFKKAGRDAFILDEQKYDGMTLSTTEVRAALKEGDTLRAADMLGLPYFIEGEVERGLGLGHKLGFPTINTALAENCPLQTGVYKTVVPIGGKLYTGLCNVGICPTFGAREIHAETMLLDFSGDLYGERLSIYFLNRIRGERTFDGAVSLNEQIAKDRTTALVSEDEKYIEMIKTKENIE